MSASDGFLDELRKRGVVRAGLLYAAGAFALLEFADIAFPRLGFPDGAVNVVLWVGLSGFPLALFASWVIEVRAEPDSGRMRGWLSPATLATSAVLVALGIGVGLVWGGSESTSSSITFDRLPSSFLIVSVFLTSTSRTRSSTRCGKTK